MSFNVNDGNDDDSVDIQMWTSFFDVGVAFSNQPTLQLEAISDLKRDKILKRYGDMRSHVGFQLLSLWSHLGDLKYQFIPGKRTLNKQRLMIELV